VKQVIIGVNKMDCSTANYGEARYVEIRDEMHDMMTKVGWKKDFLEKSVPAIPISGWIGDNLIKQSDKMTWWKGVDVLGLDGNTHHVTTLLDALNDYVSPPERETSKPLRLPISGVYKIKGVGDVLAGRVEQGEVLTNKEVVFLPSHTTGVPCEGKVFTIEMHHKRVESAKPGDNVGMNVKNLSKTNPPKGGDVMIYKGDTSLKHNSEFTAQIQTLDIPGEVKVGYSPIGFVRCARSACRLSKLNWKIGKETGGKKAEGPTVLKSNEMAECVFTPMQPMIVDSFKNCEGLSRIAFLDGNTAVMLGKIVSVVTKEM